MKIAIDFGHGTGQDRGAVGILSEENVIRQYGPILINNLKSLGHTIINVTPGPNLTLNQSLAARVNAANMSNVDLFVSCHVNAFNGTAHGCEVEYISNLGKGYATKISNEIAKLGFTNRGPQLRTGLYVLKHTNAPAILIEPFFCDNTGDCKLYNASKLANAITIGLTGKSVLTEPKKTPVTPAATTTATVTKKMPPIDHTIPDNPYVVWKSPNGLGYVESIPESGRFIIHLDKYNYVSIQDNGKTDPAITLTTRKNYAK